MQALPVPLNTDLRNTLSGLRRARIRRVRLLCAGLGILLFAPMPGAEPVTGDEFEKETRGTSGSGAEGIRTDLELGLHRKLLDRVAASDARMEAFTTDGCSGGLSVGWEFLAAQSDRFSQVHGGVPPWEHCCIEHDRSYHRGAVPGSTALESFGAREQADRALHACVLAHAAQRRDRLRHEYGLTAREVEILYRTIADSMYRAVRLGGVPCSGLSWRWGYGWPEC